MVAMVASFGGETGALEREVRRMVGERVTHRSVIRRVVPPFSCIFCSHAQLRNVMPLTTRQKSIYDWFKAREAGLRAESEKNGGKLPWHENWRYHYYSYPYLLQEPDEVIRERFSDIFINTVDISSDGKLSITPMLQNEGRLGRIFTEVIEETNWRAILTKDAVAYATAPISAYFSDGSPLGFRMFGDRQHISGEWLVKYSKSAHIRDMLSYGRIRISPASYYSRGSHIKAVKDLETERDYRLKALIDVLKGRDHFELQGKRIEIKNGVVPISFQTDDYYLFSSCKEIDRRLPTDFEADAALIIKDRRGFISRIKEAMMRSHPTWEFLQGEVYYYDPYNDLPKDPNQELKKHFRYSYQKEHRCVLRHRVSPAPPMQLEPFFVELGSLSDIAEAVYSP
jgi:hypothetical protein